MPNDNRAFWWAALAVFFLLSLLVFQTQFRYRYFEQGRNDEMIVRVDRLTQETARSLRGSPFR